MDQITFAGDPTVAGYDPLSIPTPIDTTSYDASTNAWLAANGGGNGVDNGTTTVTTSSIDPNAVNAVSSIGNSVANIFKSLTGGNVVYGPAPAFGSAPSTVSGLASSLTSSVSSFLPLIFIGIVVYMLFGVAHKQGK